MLNRRILRIKVFKAIYSYAENPDLSLKETQAQLEISCKSTRNLYLFMLALIPALTQEASNRIEAARNKFHPTEEERNPNLKFVGNKIAAIFGSDPDFIKIIDREKISWEQYDAFLRKLFDSIKTKDYYKSYMESEQSSIKEDTKLFCRIFEDELVDNQDLEEILEDLSIYWNDDLAYALTCCCRSLESISDGNQWSLPPLYQSEMSKSGGMDSDRAFATNLLRAAYTSYNTYLEKISSSVPKWDPDRLFILDIVLIVCGLAEARTFPEIPIKVTINEYVDITRYYSTPKSRSFVNGLLDTIIQKMMQDGEIVKSGRGLL